MSSIMVGEEVGRERQGRGDGEMRERERRLRDEGEGEERYESYYALQVFSMSSTMWELSAMSYTPSERGIQ